MHRNLCIKTKMGITIIQCIGHKVAVSPSCDGHLEIWQLIWFIPSTILFYSSNRNTELCTWGYLVGYGCYTNATVKPALKFWIATDLWRVLWKKEITYVSVGERTVINQTSGVVLMKTRSHRFIQLIIHLVKRIVCGFISCDTMEFVVHSKSTIRLLTEDAICVNVKFWLVTKPRESFHLWT